MSSTPDSAGPSARQRPLSPHLSVYTLIPTMLASIMHRITGVALYFGTVLIAWWLIAAASGPAYFDFVNGLYASWFGLIVLFGYSWVLIHHLLGGLRHFVWDTGRMLDKDTATRLAYASFIGSASLTVLVWLIALVAR